MTYRCSRVVDQEAVELEILDLVCKVTAPHLSCWGLRDHQELITLIAFSGMQLTVFPLCHELCLLKFCLLKHLCQRWSKMLVVLSVGALHYTMYWFPIISTLLLSFFFFQPLCCFRKAPPLPWSPPSAGRTASCFFTPSHNGLAFWRSLDSRGSSTKPNRAWVGEPEGQGGDVTLRRDLEV